MGGNILLRSAGVKVEGRICWGEHSTTNNFYAWQALG